MENSSETLKRLNNKLGGFGLLDGSRTPANWNGASFRNVSPFLQEICNPTGQLLDHLIEPTSAAFFDKLHLRAQERILALLFQASPAQLQPVRAKIGALLARHQIPATNAASSKNELLSATWIPRLAAAAAEVHGFANGVTKPTTVALNIIDQDATNILQLLAPPPPSATTTAAAPQHTELDALRQPQALEWAQWHANQRKTYDVAAVTHHLSKVGVSRHLPYDVLIGGKHKEDIVKTYHISVPDCIQQLHATKFLGTDIDFTQKARPMGTSGSSGSSFSSSSASSASSASSSSSSASSADSHITNAQRQQQAQAARQKAAQDKAKKDAQVKANLARAITGGGVSGKRPRSEEGGGKGRTAVSLTVATNNTSKKQAITNANGQPTSSPRNYTASLHESNLNTYLQLIKDNAPANRLALIKQNNEYMHRLKDFATGAPEKTGKLDPKTGKNKTFSAINLKLEDGYLYALHLDYKTLQCTVQKKKRASKKKK